MLFVFMPFIEWETTCNMGVIDLIAILFYGLMFQKTCWLNMVHNWSNSFRFQWYRGITITLPWLFLILDKALVSRDLSRVLLRDDPRRSARAMPMPLMLSGGRIRRLGRSPHAAAWGPGFWVVPWIYTDAMICWDCSLLFYHYFLAILCN